MEGGIQDMNALYTNPFTAKMGISHNVQTER